MATTVAPYEPLAANFAGEILLPEHPNYESERRLWNGMFDARPAVLAQCRGVGDVVAAIRFARAEGLDVCVRGGGHAVDGKTIVDDGFVIDLSKMTGVFVDPASRRALVQGGALWSDLDRESQLHGLATTGGAVSHTGVAGLTLGGGVGWLQRLYGTTCSNVVSFEAVTVEGEIIRVSADENAELYWGMRGGGGNFAIVTTFEFQLHPVPTTVMLGTAMHAGDRAVDALRFFRDFAEAAPDELASSATIGRVPALDAFPADFHNQLFVSFLATYIGPLEDGEESLHPLARWGPPLMSSVEPMTYVGLQKLPEAMLPFMGTNAAARVYSKSLHLPALTDEAIEVLVEQYRNAPPFAPGKFECAQTSILRMGGALAREPRDSMAFTCTDAAYYFDSAVVWEDADRDDHWIGWERSYADTMEPFTTGGQYLNFGSDADVAKIEQALGSDKYRRLVELKNRWDPENVLRHNKNIPPSI